MRQAYNVRKNLPIFIEDWMYEYFAKKNEKYTFLALPVSSTTRAPPYCLFCAILSVYYRDFNILFLCICERPQILCVYLCNSSGTKHRNKADYKTFFLLFFVLFILYVFLFHFFSKEWIKLASRCYAFLRLNFPFYDRKFMYMLQIMWKCTLIMMIDRKSFSNFRYKNFSTIINILKFLQIYMDIHREKI